VIPLEGDKEDFIGRKVRKLMKMMNRIIGNKKDRKCRKRNGAILSVRKSK